MTKIVVLQGHPDGSGQHLCHGLADAYANGAAEAGHEVRRIDVARLDFPVLRSQADWMAGAEGTPQSLLEAQAHLREMDHLFVVYPLWFGGMPALLKAMLEQVLRPGIALDYAEHWPKPLMKGKSARIVVTMGMPAFVYRWYFGAHSLKSLERNILKFAGFNPVRDSLFGIVDGASDSQRRKWLDQMHKLGRDAA